MGTLRYGVNWNSRLTDMHIELIAFRDGTKTYGGDEDNRQFHFKNIVKMFWGTKSKKPFIWNPWTDRMLDAACNHKYFFLSGSASSGKTYFMAMWGIVNWLCAPEETLVLFTSTSLEDSRRRIWGDVEGFLQAATDDKGRMLLPAKILSSTGKVRTFENGVTRPDKCGLQLIPGDRAKERENIGKLIGAKNKRVLLFADELPELSPALIEAAKSNLMANPFFQMGGSGNFKSLYDPFGQMCEPLDGWGSVTPDFDDWKTKDGVCLRFDGLRSPNILEGKDKYAGVYGITQLENHKKLGENTSTFWRMCRSFPCPEADADRIYAESDLLKGDVVSVNVKWKDEPVKVSAIDEAFVNGGDEAIQTDGLFGISTENKQVLLLTYQGPVRDDVRNKMDNRSVQVAKQWRDNCVAKGIDPKNAAYDASGGGVAFGGIVSEVWSNAPLGVQFGGGASDRPASVKDRRPSKEAFANRVAEIWYAGVDFVQSGQIKGVPSECCTELTERRKIETIKSASGLKVRIESKKDMKGRTGGKSPDRADSFLILLELCRERLGFMAVGMEGKRLLVNEDKKRRLRLVNRIYMNNTHQYSYAESEAA